MIITQEYLTAMDACQEGMDVVNQLSLCGLDDKAFAKALVDNGHTEYAVWLKQVINSAASIKFLGDYTVTRYMVFNPLTGQYEYADTIEETKVLRDKFVADYVAANVMPLIDVQEEITNAEGAVASSKITLGA